MSTKRYNLTQRQQLVDVNNSLVNFEANISATSLDQTPFDAIVVTQKELEASPQLDFKRVEQGVFGVSISQNKNVYENFFLVLRSDVTTTVDVTVEVVELPMLEPAGGAQPPIQIESRPLPPTPQPPLDAGYTLAPKQSFLKTNWKLVAIVLIIVVGGAAMWYFYKTRSTGGGFFSSFRPRPAIVTPPVAALPATEPQPEADTSVDPELLGKLKNMFS